ncbi:HNH endonuclease signature motif containing protein [Gordonia sp. WA4-43]|uniref:HNH endonuclease signature motif containing protein n=1 Tax=Gordonia sp. WA4-43 TaxID=2878678 RepID=UPI001CFC09B0|nr:HNH endonuclease signature motif containing protein [Gordonia sp. WA4-43]UCZ89468.1 HNH endonuclease [Gordonia sp. WA4-43]
MFDGADPESLTDEVLEGRVLGYAAQITALTADFLELVAELDGRESWRGPGIHSLAHWLSWKAGIAPRTAHEQLRVAKAIRELPAIRTAFREGRLTYSKVRALTRVATPEREAELVNLALSCTASQLDRAVRAMGQVDRNCGVEEESRPPVESTGRWKWNDDGSLSVSLRLSPLDGARFLAGTVRAEYERTRTCDDPDLPSAESVPRNTDAGSAPEDSEVVPSRRRDLWRQVPSNVAPAVVAMADMVHDGIAMPDLAPGAEILIHAGDGVESAHLDDGPALSEAEVDEARCGASTRDVVSRRVPGQPGKLALLGVGRRKRVPNKALIRALFVRDRCCQVPGCGRTRHLHAHHVQLWSAGGRTDPDNLISLCGSCHRALHQGEFAITAHGEQRFSFHRPDGAEIEAAPKTSKPPEWQPNPRIDTEATVPIGGGRMDLGYTTEVLYAVWEWKQRNETRSAPVVREAA